MFMSGENEPMTAGFSDDTRWQAVQSRNPDFDGVFVYAVRSTGIYCRPSCPSRRPRREQARFFPYAAAAEEAGYRPCRRCRPRDVASPQVTMVSRVCRWIESHLEEPLTLATLSEMSGVSRYHLQRTFKRLLGITPRHYVDACRLARFKRELRSGDDVTAALYSAGYGSSSRLYERAATQLGMSPSVYRNHGRGVTIRCAIADRASGYLLAGWTEHGFCAIEIAGSVEEIVARLDREYPGSTIQQASEPVREWVRAHAELIDRDPSHPDLPADIAATAFRRRLWEALRRDVTRPGFRVDLSGTLRAG
jgi:AraC family transcriptional regulator, regulatory protein of adaptative response / methylated-DNA-[protein]-cysteine methyltransferase